MDIKYIENANQTYPQWDIEITKAIMEKFKRIHKVLRSNGYNVRCANVAEKDNKFFWILLEKDNENFKLEQYGYVEAIRKEIEMNFYNFMVMHDNWNGNITVNDNSLKPIVKGVISDVIFKHPYLHNREVVSFGFYDGELTVRIKEKES